MITIRYLLSGPVKFNQLKRDMGNVSSKTLSRSLNHLMRQGLVERRVLDNSPISVEYSLTDKGRELNGALQAMAKWGNRWLLGQMAQRQEEPVMLRTRTSA
jgi:DNA-binding HxlR family transcriptional regulator